MNDEPTAVCNLCDPKRRVFLRELPNHLRIVHAIVVEPERWPDGELVVIDSTLEPEDFEA